MAWKQCIVGPFTDSLPIVDMLIVQALRDAVAGCLDDHVALLSMKVESGGALLVLTPEAAAYAKALPGDWSDIQPPNLDGWSLLYTAGATMAELGLRPH